MASLSDSASSSIEGLEVRSFESSTALDEWLRSHHGTSPGIWIRVFKKRSGRASVSVAEVLELTLMHGWSESKRLGCDETSYLQRITSRRTVGTTSERNLAIVERLISGGLMTSAGRVALGLPTAE